MLLVIDIGNTNIVFGVFDDEKLVNHWRLSTVLNKTVDEYAILLSSLIYFEKIKLSDIESAIISCVVPPLLIPFEILCRRYIFIKPIIVEPGIKTGMPIQYDNPQEVGADRIVNAVAGYEKHKKSLIIVDFGTATTFDYISSKGDYMGGAIAPGMLISLEALFERASKLPRVELIRPKNIIGKNTVNAMQAGITYGYVSLVDGIVNKIKEEVRTNPHVIATGGFANLIFEDSNTLDEVDEFLTLKGLKILYDKNKDFHKFK
ncbi:MAG TPA: type III pantothenate kinase [Syntrophorhabdaceae bacterium]|nr:type III pantothenate kinase [Syntrophorhabdaceae bacterium]HQM77203.1 type III pantothenate kinase [Syntrophorhabdaceae bacterium]